MKKNKLLNLILPLFLVLLCIFLPQTLYAQRKTVTGQVLDNLNDPLIGVSVLIKGTTTGTTTDIDGNFSLGVSPEDILVFSYLGMKDQEIPVGNRTSIQVTMVENTTLLDEVVVIGYGTTTRKDLTTAVSTVSTEDLDQRPIISAAQAIQGKAAGVSVVSPNGLPGETPVIRVRGTTSMNANNDPLYVVDGVPMTDISFLSANDIESMQILKDASSAAIYGSRAANGVIMITTKQGRKGQSKIALNAYLGITNLAKKIESLNLAEYKEYLKDLGSTIVLPDNLTDQTDWYEETFTTGITQNYQLSIANADDKYKYYISGGYTGEQGIIKVASYERFNFRSNLENQIRSWLNVSANIAYSDYSSSGIISGTGANRGGVILSVVNTPTYAPIWDPNNPGQYYNNFYGPSITHPVENMSRNEDEKHKNNRLLATGKAVISFMKDLTFSSSVTLDRSYYHGTSFVDPYKTSWGRNVKGRGSDQRSLGTVMVYDNILNFKHSWNKHTLDLMGGASGTTSVWSQSNISASYFYGNEIKTLNTANRIDPYDTWTTAADWAIMSYIGRVSYNYDSKYLVTANMRADGSSKLAPKNKWGYFPSVSAAWRLSSESFLEDIDWIYDLKLRGGWGQTGNQSGLGDYAYLERYSISRLPWWETENANAVPSLSQASLRATDLKWETTTQSNIGLDLSLFRGRLSFVADYYYKNTTDMLVWVDVPAGAAPVTSIQRNEAAMTNKGVEFSLSTKNFTGGFTWDTDLNMSFNKNELTKLTLKKIYEDAKTSENVNEAVVRNMVGQPLGRFFGYISDGVDPETGELMYRDITEDGQVNTSDRTYIGDPNPDFTFGMTNTFSYKGLSLSIFLQGSYGNEIFNASRMETEGMYDAKNQSKRVLERWTRPGQIRDVPKAGYEMKNSTYFVEDGSYLRIKDVSVSYEIKNSLLRKWGINRLQPYITASNLYTLTKYRGLDPEVNQWGNSGSVQGVDWGTYPHTRSFIFGLNVEF